MNRNSLLTVGAALTIAGAAVVGGYFVDRKPTNQAVEFASLSAPHSVTVPPPGVKSTAQVKSLATTSVATVTAPAAQPAKTPLLRDTVADNTLVAMSGMVTDKKGGVLTVQEASGPVRVVMREDVLRPRDMAVGVARATDKIDIGTSVTVYGKLRTNDETPKLYADAVYDPATKTLYQINGDRPAVDLGAARYAPVGNVQAPRVSMNKISKISTDR